MASSLDFDGQPFSLVRRAVEMGLISDDDAARLLQDGVDELSIVDALLESGFISQVDLTRLVAEARDADTSRADAAESTPVIGAGGADERAPRLIGTGQEDAASKYGTPGADADATNSLPGLPPRYRLQGSLGKGGMGCVYRAFDLELQRTVAIKVGAARKFRRALSDMMRREREVLAQLNDPGIVSVFDSGHLADDSPFFVMQYVAGRNLKDFVTTERLNVRQIARLMQRVAESLSRAHLLRIIHRDLKPQNILVTSEGRPVLLDFGLAKPTDLAPEPDGGRTAFSYETLFDGQVVGTPAYMSPEQAAGADVDARTDVYSFGVMLYELLAGEHPRILARTSTSPAEEPADPCGPQPPPLRHVCRDVPADLAAIVDRCLHCEPAERYADAQEVTRELERFLTGWPVATYARRRPLYRLRRAIQRNPGTSAIVAVCLLLLVSTVVAWDAYLKSLLSMRNAELKFWAAQLKADVEVEAIRERGEQDRTRTRQRGSVISAQRHSKNGQPILAAAEFDQLPDQPDDPWELARVRLQTSGPTANLVDAHEFEILASLTSANGRWLVTSGQDGRVLLRDLRAGDRRELRSGVWSTTKRRWVTFHPFYVRDETEPLQPRYAEAFFDVCWLRDGESVAGVSWLPPDAPRERPNKEQLADWYQGRLVRWDLASGTEQVLWVHSRPLVACAAAPDESVLLADVDGRMWHWTPEAVAPQILELPETGSVVDILALADWGWLVARKTGRLQFLNRSRVVVTEWEAESPVLDVDARPLGDGDAMQLAVATASQAVALLRVERQLVPQLTSRLRLPDARRVSVHLAADTVKFHPRANRLYVGDSEGNVAVWNVDEERLISAFPVETAGRTLERVTTHLPRVSQRAITGIEVPSAEETIWVVGRDTNIKQLDATPHDFITRWKLPANAHIVFDRQHPTRLWVAADASVTLLDTLSGVTLSQQRLEPERRDAEAVVADITSAGATPRVAVAAGQRIHFLGYEDGRILNARAPIDHDTAIRGLSLHPNGQSIAAYDTQNRVHLWELGTGRCTKSLSLADQQEVGAIAAGLVRFNPAGTQLVIAGMRQDVRVYDASLGQLISNPYVNNGTVVTDIAWHPRVEDRLFAVDDDGGWASNHEVPGVTQLNRDRSPTAAVDCSPDGRRVVRATVDGEVIVTALDGEGDIYEFASPHVSETGTVLTDVLFDPTGERLALLHADGELEIYETRILAPQIVPAPVSMPHAWEHETRILPVAPDQELSAVRFCLDDQERMWLLYLVHRKLDLSSEGFRTVATLVEQEIDDLKLKGEAPEELVQQLYARLAKLDANDDANQCTIYVARVDQDAIEHRKLGELGVLENRQANECRSSLALASHGKSVFCVYRKPYPQLNSFDGHVVVHELDLDSLHRRQRPIALDQRRNWGFDMRALIDPQGDLLITHYSFDGYYFGLFRRQADRWRHHWIGRQGDGGTAWADVDGEGRVHTLFRRTRSNVDRNLLVYLRVADETIPYHPHRDSATIREPVDQRDRWTIMSGMLDHNDRPMTRYLVSRRDGRFDLVFARREANGWQSEVVMTDAARQHLSNLTVDAKGRPCFVRATGDAGAYALQLVTRTAGGWQAAPIRAAEVEASQVASSRPMTNLTIMHDSHQDPVVTYFIGHELHTLRPAKP